jgi:hypothetical protein
MSQQKNFFDMSDTILVFKKFPRTQATSFGNNDVEYKKSTIKTLLLEKILGCSIFDKDITLNGDGTADVEILGLLNDESKRIGTLTVILEKTTGEGKQRKSGCSNSVIEALVTQKITLAQLTQDDFDFASAEEKLAEKLKNVPASRNTQGTMAKAFSNAFSRCTVWWQNLRPSAPKESSDYHPNWSFTSVSINPVEEIKRYTRAFNAMAALLVNPRDDESYKTLKEVATTTLGGNQSGYGKIMTSGVFLVVGLALFVFFLSVMTPVGYIPPNTVYEVVFSILNMLAGAFLTSVGAVMLGTSIYNRLSALQETGLYDAVEKVEALKNRLPTESSIDQKHLNEVASNQSSAAHPAGNSSAYGTVVTPTKDQEKANNSELFDELKGNYKKQTL